MKINDKIFSLPPYISTTWSNISTVRLKDHQLVITLIDGSSVQIPSLPSEILETIFKTHAEYLEGAEHRSSSVPTSLPSTIQFGMAPIDGMSGTIMQHDPNASNSPPIPPEILKKICTITKILAPEDLLNLPPAEPDCNCLHCQLIRAIGGQKMDIEVVEIADEIVVDEELEFRQWDIESNGDKLYTVTSRLNTNEKYSVYLGDPIGCTCGQSGCEHIITVLKT